MALWLSLLLLKSGHALLSESLAKVGGGFVVVRRVVSGERQVEEKRVLMQRYSAKELVLVQIHLDAMFLLEQLALAAGLRLA